MPPPETLVLICVTYFTFDSFKQQPELLALAKWFYIKTVEIQKSSLVFKKCHTFTPCNNSGNFLKTAKTQSKNLYTHTKVIKDQWIKD